MELCNVDWCRGDEERTAACEAFRERIRAYIEERFGPLMKAIEDNAAREAYEAELGAGEWEAMLSNNVCTALAQARKEE